MEAREETTILKNFWYVAAEPEEIGQLPMSRTICNERIVFWRTGDGTPIAFEDRCCHRRMPLSKGTVVGDTLRCHYHGLEFDAAGACVHVPGQTAVTPDARVRAYPLVERYNRVWIWIGDPALADASEIVPFPWKDSEDWGDKGIYFHVNCDYRLIVDWRPPEIVRLSVGSAPDAAEGEDFAFIDLDHPTPNGGFGRRNLNAITPETENTCHYFWSHAHDSKPITEETTDALFRQIRTAFRQD